MNDKYASNQYVAKEKLKYRPDKLAYAFALLGLFINVLYFITLYKNNDNFYYSWKMGVSVLYNLIFMLLVFLFAEEIKYYHRNYAIALTVVGLLQFVRIFVYPRQGLLASALTSRTYTILWIYLLISGILLITGGICSYVKSTILRNFLKNSTLENREV